MTGPILYSDSKASGVRTGDIEGCGCRSCAGKTRPGQLGAFILSGKVRRKKNLLQDTLQFTNYLGEQNKNGWIQCKHRVICSEPVLQGSIIGLDSPSIATSISPALFTPSIP
jgi:hypothetical protein